jgi:membrane protease YdiL (CAAX protease family)
MSRRFVTALIGAYLACLIVASGLVLYLYRAQVWMFAVEHDRQPLPLVLLMLAAGLGLAMIFCVIALGRYVYVDSRRRGMDPLLWTFVAIFVPYFLGLVAYLVIRKPLPPECPACRGAVPQEVAFCPHCGQALKHQCGTCQAPVAGGYRFCPSCGAAVPVSHPE